MTNELIIALSVFSLVSSITPGPNNLMLMASGANFGFARSIPHMAGIALGFTFMVAMVGIGLAQVFELYPAVGTVLKIASVAYLLYLASKIARAAAPGANSSETGRPFTFLQAAAFQWVNPKAWAMALTAISAYAPDRTLATVLTVSAIFGAINLPSISVWTLAGQEVRRFLINGRRLAIFNATMALLLVASLYPVLFSR